MNKNIPFLHDWKATKIVDIDESLKQKPVATFEYWQRRLSPDKLHTQAEFDMMKEMGDAGWTLQMISQDASYFYFYFIREQKELETK